MKAQIETCRGSGGRQHKAVIDVENVWVDFDSGMSLGEQPGCTPVGRRAPTVERARRGKKERAGTNGGDARTAIHGAAKRTYDRIGRRSTQVVHAGHDHRVRAAEGRESVGDLERDVLRPDFGLLAANPKLVGGAAVTSLGASEHLGWHGEIRENDAIERQDCHETWPASTFAAPWRESFEHCLFCHWAHSASIRTFVPGGRTRCIIPPRSRSPTT